MLTLSFFKKRKKDKKCSECIWASYIKADFIFGCGYICHLNPFKKIAMGLNGKHSQRKERTKK